ncbi:MAG: GGDEF domain-containing protein [Firmicutes bacterium]|nr:GGDEF domain-containing protein [Bacillota bacterium]
MLDNIQDHKIKTRLRVNLYLQLVTVLTFLLVVNYRYFSIRTLYRDQRLYLIVVFCFMLIYLFPKGYLFKQKISLLLKLFWLIDLLDVLLVSLLYHLGFFPVNFLLPLYLIVIFLSTREIKPGETYYVTLLSLAGLTINIILLWPNNFALTRELGYTPLSFVFLVLFALASILLIGFLAASYSSTDQQLTSRLQKMLIEKEAVLKESYLTQADLEEKYAFSYTLTLIQQFLLEEMDEENLLTNIADIIQGVLGSFTCAIFGINYENQIEILSFSGKDAPALLKVVNEKDSLVAQTIATQTIQDENSASPEELEYWKRQGIYSLVTVPLVTKTETIGVILAANQQKFSFNQEQKEQLMIIANQVSLALENTRLHQETKKMAWHDSLTGLYNRNYMNIFLFSIFQDNNNLQLGCIIFDLDFFKEVNDTYGHLTGDQVLAKTANILKKYSTHDRIACRHGGEEFIMLGLNHQPAELAAIAETIRQEIETTPFFATEDQPFHLTISCGVAGIPEHASTISDLLARADQALYQAKNSGRNLVVVYGQE